jgi:CDP-glucose 4,6-dehydratase
MFSNSYQDRSVLVTGHTGFKGSWLCEWLLSLGAQVTGLGLDPEGEQPFFDSLGLPARLQVDLRQDIRDLPALVSAISSLRPDFVFHLAAQPLVRLSYDIPVETFAANVMGTAHVLEAVRLSGHVCTVVVITTDKCYENREWLHSYREEDAMGGYDPYSASKGCAELVVSAYRRSFFSHPNSPVRLASARAGNVIGGGDWANDRIIPDCIRALQAGQSIPVRNKTATRPWQHVLEPLSGYLWLGASLATATPASNVPLSTLASGFNFGPALTSNRTVAELVQELLKHFPEGTWEDRSDPNALHEASKLNLAIDKAFHLLQWQPVWDFERTLAETAIWYAADPSLGIAELTARQIESYSNSARQTGLPWAF